MPKVITYNAGISACEKGHRPTGPHKLQQLRPRGVMPNGITYNAAISACETGQKPQQARISCRSCSLTPLPTAQYQRLRQGPNG